MIKNIDMGEVMEIADQVQYLKGQVVSKTLSQNPAVSVTLFAFDKGEEISTHESKGDAMVLILDDTGRITIDGNEHNVSKGQAIVMPANRPHSVSAPDGMFKMLLVVVFPRNDVIGIN